MGQSKIQRNIENMRQAAKEGKFKEYRGVMSYWGCST